MNFFDGSSTETLERTEYLCQFTIEALCNMVKGIHENCEAGQLKALENDDESQHMICVFTCQITADLMIKMCEMINQLSDEIEKNGDEDPIQGIFKSIQGKLLLIPRLIELITERTECTREQMEVQDAAGSSRNYLVVAAIHYILLALLLKMVSQVCLLDTSLGTKTVGYSGLN